jgi:hypothetical protein
MRVSYCAGPPLPAPGVACACGPDYHGRMQHRFRRWLRSDRTFWTLLALTLVGVTAAYYVAREAEKRQTEWVHGLERTGPAPTEPWKNAATAVPWPECVDGAGRPMVVQFCTYALLSNGEWVPSKNTGDAPRCRAELPLVKQGKVRGAPAR